MGISRQRPSFDMSFVMQDTLAVKICSITGIGFAKRLKWRLSSDNWFLLMP